VPAGDRLEKYRKMRSAGATPEPFGGSAARPRLFVVQKHAARRMHWDFRLEWEGALWSWAIPQGPSHDPAVKRLAVEVEDHPVEYAEFEGIIPKDNYGAGAVILWDRGTWVPIEEPGTGREKGKLLFDLHGYKLGGRWTLVRTKRQSGQGPQKEWLLIKKADGHAAPEGERPYPPESILSGLTVEELRDGPGRRAEEVMAALEAAGAPRHAVTPRAADLMLAETAERPPGGPGWLFELKYDGFRMLAGRADGKTKLLYRKGGDATTAFPEIARAVSLLPFESFVIDGEITVPDEQGHPRFHFLQQRFQLRRHAEIERASFERPAVLWVFDVLGVGPFDARPLPLRARKDILRRMLPRAGPVRFADHIDGEGAAFYDAVKKMGLEGVMAKRADARYRAGRSPDWLKVKADRTGDFAVVGFTHPEGSRRGFGALHIAGAVDGKLVYAGKVGTGFSDAELGALRKSLEPDRRKTPACLGSPPKGRGHTWVEPRLVVEVRYKEWTPEGQLRQPAYLRLRDDKRPEDADRPDVRAREAEAPAAASPASAPPAPLEKKISFTNRDKLFWPADGYTKGDLIDYYRAVHPWLGAYLRDRPVVLTRYPDGIDGKSFFQKDAPEWAPGWLRTERMWSEDTARDIDYFVCDDVESLLYVANMGCIPLHVWSSRVATVGQPDWSIIDLDPKGAPFSDVVALALAIHELCEDIELPTFVKTSGSTGLHVLVPLGGLCTFDQAKSFGEILAKVVEAENPTLGTTERVISARGGRVYLDFLQNGHGKLLVAPFSVRPLPGAPVSTPLEWSEVGPDLRMGDHTIRTVPPRFEKLGADPLAPVLTLRPDLGRALAGLGERLARAQGKKKG